MSAFNGTNGIDHGHIAPKFLPLLFVILLIFCALQDLGQGVHATQKALFQGVLSERNEFWRFPFQFLSEHSGQFIFVQEAIDQPRLQCVLRSANGQVIGQVVKCAFRQPTRSLHILGHVLPETFEQCHGLFAVFCAESLSEKRFHCTLVLVVGATDHGDTDAQLLQHSGVEHALGPKAAQRHASLRVQVHLVRRRIEMQSPLAHGLAPCHDKLSAVLQNAQSGPQILHHAWHDGDIGHIQQHTIDLIITCRAVKCVQNLVQAHLHIGLQTSSKAEGERQVAASPLHDARRQRDLENVGILQLQVGASGILDVGECPDQSPDKYPHKNEDENCSCNEET